MKTSCKSAAPEARSHEAGPDAAARECPSRPAWRTPRGAAGLTAVLGVVAMVLTAGFLFWLYQRTSSLEETVQPVMEDTLEEAAGGPALTLEELRASPAEAVGRRAALEEAEVSTRLGRAVFAIRLDEAGTYPVLLSRDLIQREIQLYGGDVVSAWGRVYTLNDSIRGEWLRAGAVDEDRREQIPASASFLLADSLVVR